MSLLLSTGVALETSVVEKERDWFTDINGLNLTFLSLSLSFQEECVIFTFPDDKLTVLSFLHYPRKGIQIVLYLSKKITINRQYK